MRPLIIFISIPLLTFAVALRSAAKDETVADLKLRFENASPHDRPELGIRIAQQQLRSADKLYREGNVDQADIDVYDVAAYCEKARDAAIQTNKHLKSVEIDVRKMADKLRDIKRTLAFDNQPPAEQAIRRLEDVRTTLLKEMFANKNDKRVKP